MISNERLKELGDDNTICKVSWDERVEMARELLALRKAFNTPFCCTTPYQYGELLAGDGAEVYPMSLFDPGDILLYRKPE